MKTIEQLCIKSFEIKAENGDCFNAIQGRFYTTTVPNDTDFITVFSNYWVKAKKSNFIPKEAEKNNSPNA